MINFKIFFGYNTKQREKTILTNFVSDHFSYPSVINPNKMSYFWSIHKRLRGSWIGHIEGPWSWSCSMTSFWTNCWIDFFDDTFDRNVCWKFYEKFIGNLRSMQGRIPSRSAQQSPSCCAATDLHLFSICLQQQQLAFFLFWIFLWLLIVSNVCSTSYIFLCLPPSGPLITGMVAQSQTWHASRKPFWSTSSSRSLEGEAEGNYGGLIGTWHQH